MLLLPLESILASASTAVIGLIGREGEQKLEISPGQGQTLFQSLHSRLVEIQLVLTSAVPVLLNNVKELHMSLTRLARTASFDAGVLHKALEGVGESQEARSQELGLGRPEIAGDEVLPTEGDKNLFENVFDNAESAGELIDDEFLLQDDEDCWISPPDSLCASRSESEISLAEGTVWQESDDHLGVSSIWDAHATRSGKTKFLEEVTYDISRLTVKDDTELTSSSFLAHSQEDPSLVGNIGIDTRFDVTEDNGIEAICLASSQFHSSKSASQRPEGSQGSISSNKVSSDSQGTMNMNLSDMGLSCSNVIERHQTEETRPGMKPKQPHINRAKGRMASYGDLCNLFSCVTTEQTNRVFRAGKNAYAVSVLKRVEAKLDGRDIDGKRQCSVSEQVDHLLRQATSIDNLCNMYEGWTPWI